MKKLVAFLLFMNIVCSAASLGDMGASREECVLARTLSEWFGVEVTTDGQNLKFSGEKAKLEAAVVKLRDFDQIRREFLPVNQGAAAIKSVAKPLESWEECLAVLNINPALVRLFNLQGTTDDAGKQLMIPAGEDFNGPVAKLYVDTLIKNSVFFKWIVDNFREQFIASIENDEGRFLAVRYGLLNQFLCLGDIAINEEQEAKDDEDAAQVQNTDCVIPRQSVLRSLVAACSGSINLERRGGNLYGVRFVSLGEGAGGSYPTVEFVIDTSGSMYDKISIINKTMPKLLAHIQSRFSRVKVRICSFSDEKRIVSEYDLVQGQPIPAFYALVANGGTNLGHIASSIPLSDDEQSKAVVAFTDGMHESGEHLLRDALEVVKVASLKGKVALPRLFRVGPGSNASEKFFKDMSGVVAGFSAYSDSIDDFCGVLVRDITHISRPRSAVSLQREGLVVSVNWMPIDVPGLFNAGAQAMDGDSIVNRHGSHVVSLPVAKEQMVAPVLDAAAAKLARKQTLELQMKRLAEELAELGDE